MNPLDKLHVGHWQGTNILQDPHSNAPDESQSNATITSVLAGKFVRVDYTWAYQGKVQEGSLLLGYQTKTNLVTAHWIDTWHMGDAVLACQGETNEKISVLGSWSVSSGPDWGWRINIEQSGEQLSIVMFVISPEGQEDLAVEATYTRA